MRNNRPAPLKLSNDVNTLKPTNNIETTPPPITAFQDTDITVDTWGTRMTISIKRNQDSESLSDGDDGLEESFQRLQFSEKPGWQATPPNSSSINSNTCHGRDCWKWNPDNHQMNSSLDATAWQHLICKEDMSKAWMTVHLQNSLQESPQQAPPTEAYLLPSSNEYLLIWSSEFHLLVSSGTLNTVLCQHTQHNSRYLQIMTVEDALYCCLLKCDLGLQAQLSSIDAQLRHILKQYLAGINQGPVTGHQIRTHPQYQTNYILATLGILIGYEFLVNTPVLHNNQLQYILLPVRLLAIQQGVNKVSVSMGFQHWLFNIQHISVPFEIEVILEVKDSNSFQRAGVLFPADCRWVLSLLADVLTKRPVTEGSEP